MKVHGDYAGNNNDKKRFSIPNKKIFTFYIHFAAELMSMRV